LNARTKTGIKLDENKEIFHYFAFYTWLPGIALIALTLSGI
jgi:hypothetical protein